MVKHITRGRDSMESQSMEGLSMSIDVLVRNFLPLEVVLNIEPLVFKIIRVTMYFNLFYLYNIIIIVIIMFRYKFIIIFKKIQILSLQIQREESTLRNNITFVVKLSQNKLFFYYLEGKKQNLCDPSHVTCLLMRLNFSTDTS